MHNSYFTIPTYKPAIGLDIFCKISLKELEEYEDEKNIMEHGNRF